MRKLVINAFAGLFSLGMLSQGGIADTLTIGSLSFDSGVSPSSNTFDLSNFTGGFNPQDGIADTELFSGTLTVTLATGTTDYTFSGIGPLTSAGPVVLAQVGSGTAVLGATLSLAVGNSSSVNIFDAVGNPAVVSLLSVGNTSLPPAGSSLDLTACDGSGNPCSNSLITVNTASASAVPEPETLWMVLTGLGVGARLIGRKQRS